MKIKLITMAAILALVTNSQGQDSLVRYVSVSAVDNPTITPSFVNPALTATDLVAGAGLTPQTAGSYNWRSWDTESVSFEDAVAAGDFFSWSVTATQDVTLTSMIIRLDRSSTGPVNFEIQASLNGATPVPLDTFDFGTGDDGEDRDLSLAAIGDLVSGDSVVFTLAAFNSTATTGTFDIENSNGAGINIFGISSVATLAIELDQDVFPENAVGDQAITVVRTGDLTDPLTVTLSVDLPDDVTIPMTLTIAADEDVAFDFFSIVDDAEEEPTETVTITASASGFADATTSIDIIDNDAAATLAVNELLADPPAGVDVNGDGVANTGSDEFIEFFNVTAAQLDLSGWTISDTNSVRHTFPDGTLLDPSCALVVTSTEDGASLPAFVGTTQVQASSTGSLGLNNAGDTITVLDAEGSSVINLLYGNEASNDESLNLDPDFTDGNTYAPHSSIADAVGTFSFGTTVAGDDPCATEFLAVTFPVSSVTETDADPATTGTITRTGGRQSCRFDGHSFE